MLYFAIGYLLFLILTGVGFRQSPDRHRMNKKTRTKQMLKKAPGQPAFSVVFQFIFADVGSFH